MSYYSLVYTNVFAYFAGDDFTARAVAIKRRNVEQRLRSYENCSKDSLFDVPTDDQVLDLSLYYFQMGGRNGLQFRVDMLLSLAMLFRSQDSRELDLKYLVMLPFENEGLNPFHVFNFDGFCFYVLLILRVGD